MKLQLSRTSSLPDAADENERANKIEAAVREAAERYAAEGRGLTGRTRPKKPRR